MGPGELAPGASPPQRAEIGHAGHTKCGDFGFFLGLDRSVVYRGFLVGSQGVVLERATGPP